MPVHFAIKADGGGHCNLIWEFDGKNNPSAAWLAHAGREVVPRCQVFERDNGEWEAKFCAFVNAPYLWIIEESAAVWQDEFLRQ